MSHWFVPQSTKPASAGASQPPAGVADAADAVGCPADFAFPQKTTPVSTQTAPAAFSAVRRVFFMTTPSGKGKMKPLCMMVQTIPFGPRSMALPIQTTIQ